MIKEELKKPGDLKLFLHTFQRDSAWFTKTRFKLDNNAVQSKVSHLEQTTTKNRPQSDH